MLPPNVIIPFDGTAAEIPTGWVRDTRFNSKFLKGASSGWGNTGGSESHSHTGSAHSHTMVAHTHGMRLGTRNTSNQYQGGTDRRDGTDTGHTHWGNDYKYSTAMAGGTLSNTVNYASTSVTPAHYVFLFIKSQGYNKIPAKGIVLSQATSRPGLAFHTSSAGRHIAGASGDVAGLTAGADTHTHDLSHTHTAVNHSHTGATLVDTSDARLAGDGTDEGTYSHAHTLYWHDYALTGSFTSLTSPAVSNVPLTKTINTYKASAPTLIAVGDIAITTEATNPTGWITCDGTNSTPNLSNYYIRTNASAGAVTEIGANTHSHDANNSHSHGSAAHTHTGSTDYVSPYGRGEGSGANITGYHGHNVFDLTANTATWNNANVSASSTDSNEPPFIKVRFIQATAAALGGNEGAFLFHLIDAMNMPNLPVEA